MKMRSQIIALGLAGVAAAAATGGIGLLSGRHLGGTIGDVIGTSQALQHSQEADMMHDAVRGDAQLAVLGALLASTMVQASAIQSPGPGIELPMSRPPGIELPRGERATGPALGPARAPESPSTDVRLGPEAPAMPSRAAGTQAGPVRLTDPALLKELTRLRRVAEPASGFGSTTAAANAAWTLGLIELHGGAVQRSPAQAQTWFERATRLGRQPLAYAGLAWCHIEGCKGPPDPAAALPGGHDRAGVAHQQAQVQVADVDAQFQGAGGDHGQQLLIVGIKGKVQIAGAEHQRIARSIEGDRTAEVPLQQLALRMAASRQGDLAPGQGLPQGEMLEPVLLRHFSLPHEVMQGPLCQRERRGYGQHGQHDGQPPLP